MTERELQKLEFDLREMNHQLREATTNLAATAATLEALAQRTREEVDALFDDRAAKETRLAKLEATYTPRIEFQEHMAANAEHHSEMRRDIVRVREGLAKVAVIGGVVTALLSAAATAAVNFVMRGLA